MISMKGIFKTATIMATVLIKNKEVLKKPLNKGQKTICYKSGADTVN